MREMVVLLTFVVVILTSIFLLGQGVATSEQIFPLMFQGGGSWESFLYGYNSNATDATVILNSRRSDGQGSQPISLNDSPAMSDHALLIPAGEVKKFSLSDNFPSVENFWIQALTPLGVHLTRDSHFYGGNGANPYGFLSIVRQVGSDSFRAKEQAIAPVVLGTDARFGQRQMAVGIVNPNNLPTGVTLQLLDSARVELGNIAFVVPAMGQAMRYLWHNGSFGDFSVNVDGGIVNLVSDQEITILGLQSFDDRVTAVARPVMGVFSPNLSPEAWIDIPVENEVIKSSNACFGGWGFDPDGPPPLLKLEYSINDGPWIEIQFTIDRPDVQNVFPAAPLKSGFGFALSLSNGQHLFKIRLTDSKGAITERSRTFTVESLSSPPIGYMDVPTEGQIFTGPVIVAGWFASEKSSMVTMTISIDGGALVAVTPISRPDVMAAFPGYAFAKGYNMVFTNLILGQHTVIARAEDSEGLVTERSCNFTVVSQPIDFEPKEGEYDLYIDPNTSTPEGAFRYNIGGNGYDWGAVFIDVASEVGSGGEKQYFINDMSLFVPCFVCNEGDLRTYIIVEDLIQKGNSSSFNEIINGTFSFSCPAYEWSGKFLSADQVDIVLSLKIPSAGSGGAGCRPFTVYARTHLQSPIF